MESLAAFAHCIASHPRAKRHRGGTGNADLKVRPAIPGKGHAIRASCTSFAWFTSIVRLKKGECSGNDICKPGCQ